MSLCSSTLWKPEAFCLWASASLAAGKVCDLQQLCSMSPLECSQEKGMLWLVNCSKSFHVLWAHLELFLFPLRIYVHSFLNMNQPVKRTHTHVNWNLSVIFFRCLMAKKAKLWFMPFAVRGYTMPYTLAQYNQMAISEATAVFCSHSWWFDIPRSRHQVHIMQPAGLRG